MSHTLAVANGDLDINALGSCDLISGQDKLSQDVAEALLSDYDYERDYGGKLQTMVVPGLGAKAMVSSEVQRILTRLQSMQSQDSSITSDERISSVSDIKVVMDKSDAHFEVSINTANASKLTMSDVVRLRPIQLAHTWPNGQMPIL